VSPSPAPPFSTSPLSVSGSVSLWESLRRRRRVPQTALRVSRWAYKSWPEEGERKCSFGRLWRSNSEPASRCRQCPSREPTDRERHSRQIETDRREGLTGEAQRSILKNTSDYLPPLLSVLSSCPVPVPARSMLLSLSLSAGRLSLSVVCCLSSPPRRFPDTRSRGPGCRGSSSGGC
jgi:hypothetical protein